MSKMEVVLREEIARLARKEVREALQPLVQEIRDLRKTVRDLKKESGNDQAAGGRARPASNRLAESTSEMPQTAAPQNPARADRNLSGGLIKKLRKRLEISQDELATLVSVSKAAVSSWEQNRAKPRKATREAVIALRVMTPSQARGALDSLKAEAGTGLRQSPDHAASDQSHS